MASAPSPSSSSSSRSPLRILFVSLLLHLLLSSSIPRSLATGFLSVRHRFAGRSRSITDLAAHDLRRRGRALAAADLPSAAAASPPTQGCTLRRLGSGRLRRATTCRWIRGAIFSGSTASHVTIALKKAILGWN
uniref:Uncharacterized protein n=1 Tax=Ananas comosus var. bracteatus TaxID=296719 RepID=A0A6V7Q0S2_ANACO|nr:unnamed protein product [Ananas comosus var. bracteatus]